MTTQEKITKAPAGRPKRIPVSSRNRLEVIGKDANFVYRIVNDVDDRIERFQQAGYELVDVNEARLSSQRVGAGTPEGTKAAMPVGMGTTGYLMKIPKEWYEEDQRAKQAQIDMSEESIKKPNIDGAYGDIKIS